MLNLDQLQALLKNQNITVHSFSEHSKASEHYVGVTFKQFDNFEWTGLIPYFYRRTALFLKTEVQLAEYLISIKPFFTKKLIEEWQKILKI